MADWFIEHEGEALLRVEGVVVFQGKTADMPDDIRKLAAEFRFDFQGKEKPCK